MNQLPLEDYLRRVAIAGAEGREIRFVGLAPIDVRGERRGSVPPGHPGPSAAEPLWGAHRQSGRPLCARDAGSDVSARFVALGGCGFAPGELAMDRRPFAQLLSDLRCHE